MHACLNTILFVSLQGTVSQLQDMTGWKGGSVLYFGDHPYTDLADASLMHGWRTGAIIKELAVMFYFLLSRCLVINYFTFVVANEFLFLLQSEIQTLNTSQFKWHVNWLQVLQQLIEQFQESEGEHSRKLIKEWIAERDQLRYCFIGYKETSSCFLRL
jgi:hypothetical protein